MRKLELILIVSAAMTSLAGAQGGFRSAGMVGPAMAKAQEYGSLQRPDVQKDLKLTDDQKAKLMAALGDAQTQSMQVNRDNQGDPDAVQAGTKKVMDTLGASIKSVLTPEQFARLHEISIQMRGAMAIADPEIQKNLKLSDDQIKQVSALQTKNREDNTSVLEKAQSGDIDRAQVAPMLMKNGAELKAALEKLLTDDQKEQLKKLGGAPFDMDPNYRPQFRFGPPRGGGN